MKLSDRERERFEAKVDRSGGPDSCHPWTGYCNEKGYGHFSVGGVPRKAHRVAWVLAGNEITPDKPNILHNCPGGDLRSCCNDRHLWDGTQADNIRDMALKGRGTRSKSGLPFGAYPNDRGNRFKSHISLNGKMVYLGTYDTPSEASEVALAQKQDSVL